MKRQHPALRMALFSVITVLTGFVVIAGFLGWRVYRYDAARNRATAVARGTIVNGLDGTGIVQVRWVDDAGRAHEQDFTVYTPAGQYHKGRTFLVAYDPANPAPQGFPAGPGTRGVHDRLAVPIGAAAGIAALLILAWAGRGLWFRRTAARPGEPVLAAALHGGHRTAPAWLGDTTWVSLAAPDSPGHPVRWQRVMWHPALAGGSVLRPVPVTAHGSLTSHRRVVIETLDGVKLVPVGRLRHRRPRLVTLRERIDVENGLVLPGGTPEPRPYRWWRPALLVAAAAAPFGMGIGYLVGGPAAVLPFAVAACALLVNGWAFTGAAP